MKRTTLVIFVIAGLAAGAAGFGLYRMGMQQGMSMAGGAAGAGTGPAAASASPPALADPAGWGVAEGEAATRRHIADGIKAGDVDPATGRKILYYHDPMVPGKKFEAPGKSPFMDMMLVPAYPGGAGGDASDITVSPRIQQNIGLRTAPVVEGELAPVVSAVGAIAWNERDQAVVQARATGYVEKLHVRATLDRVARGQPLLELYVPDWVAAQEEYLALRRMQGADLAPLVDAARARMRQAGMGPEHIRLVESSGRVQARLSIRAPVAGVVTELSAREGMTVTPGTTLVRINGVASVWAHAEVPESQAALLRPGARVSATSPAVPGASFDGKVQSLLPEVNPATRTLRARMELANPDGQLVPGMFVSMNFTDLQADTALLVPSEALIHTGRRSLVMLAGDGGRFRPVEVETGIESGGQTEIRGGLQAGQRVVVSGQFLIDSEASLKGLEARLGTEAVAPDRHHTVARVEAVDGDMLTLTHPAIPSLAWPGMTMDFRLAPDLAAPADVAAGADVDIEFRMQEDDAPQILSIRRTAQGTAPGGAR